MMNEPVNRAGEWVMNLSNMRTLGGPALVLALCKALLFNNFFTNEVVFVSPILVANECESRNTIFRALKVEKVKYDSTTHSATAAGRTHQSLSEPA